MEDMKNIDIDPFTICIFKIWTKNEALSLDVRINGTFLTILEMNLIKPLSCLINAFLIIGAIWHQNISSTRNESLFCIIVMC